MRILVACEESQAVCKAFREKGHKAFSCDIQPCSGGHPEWHIQKDVLQVLNLPIWDMVIAFPPCTYLSNAGAVRLYAKKGVLNKERFSKGLEGRHFFMQFLNAPIAKICVENPIPSTVYNLPKYTQTIQPYQFGHPFTKKTCLWLKNLPPLKPTKIITENITPWVAAGTKDGRGQPRKNIGCQTSALMRSKTFYGVAKAMAEQWG